MLHRHMLALFLLGFVPPFVMLIGLAMVNDDLSDRIRKNPTYHCDGSMTRGFAEPGSPEASACWFEVQK